MKNMNVKTLKPTIDPDALAMIGSGKVGYIKRMRSDELSEKFPQLPPIAPGIELWALFGAAGEPILLSDVRSRALETANEQELLTVTLQ